MSTRWSKRKFNHQFETKTWFSNFWKYPDLQWRALVTFSLFLPTRGFPSLRCGQWRLHYEVDQPGNEKCLFRKSNKKSLQWLDAHCSLTSQASLSSNYFLQTLSKKSNWWFCHRTEMYNIVDAIYQMVVGIFFKLVFQKIWFDLKLRSVALWYM